MSARAGLLGTMMCWCSAAHRPAMAATLDRLGYDGVVALKGLASGDPAVALERIRTAFTPPR